MKRKKRQLARETAFKARPFKVPAHDIEPRDDGGMNIVIAYPRPGWHRFLGAKEMEFHKRFQLDRYGAEVYRACDGHRSVRSLIGDFADRHGLSLAEAEVSVTAFLKMLIKRRLVQVAFKADEESHA